MSSQNPGSLVHLENIDCSEYKFGLVPVVSLKSKRNQVLKVQKQKLLIGYFKHRCHVAENTKQ